MAAKENEVQKACLQYLQMICKCFVWRQNNQGRFLPKAGKWIPTAGMKGVADILGIMPGGRFISVECKSASGKPSLDQIEFRRQVTNKGGLALIVRSLDELIELMPKEV